MEFGRPQWPRTTYLRGPGGLPINIDVLVNIGRQTASGLLAAAIRKGIAPLVRVLHRWIARLITVVRNDDGAPVRYIVDPPEGLTALDAMPADYEITIRTESRTRVWRDGRWERYESTTKEERGTGGPS